MATHSSILAWRIPGMGEPGGLLSLGLHGVRHISKRLPLERDRTLYNGNLKIPQYQDESANNFSVTATWQLY